MSGTPPGAWASELLKDDIFRKAMPPCPYDFSVDPLGGPAPAPPQPAAPPAPAPAPQPVAPAAPQAAAPMPDSAVQAPSFSDLVDDMPSEASFQQTQPAPQPAAPQQAPQPVQQARAPQPQAPVQAPAAPAPMAAPKAAAQASGGGSKIAIIGGIGGVVAIGAAAAIYFFVIKGGAPAADKVAATPAPAPAPVAAPATPAPAAVEGTPQLDANGQPIPADAAAATPGTPAPGTPAPGAPTPAAKTATPAAPVAPVAAAKTATPAPTAAPTPAPAAKVAAKTATPAPAPAAPTPKFKLVFGPFEGNSARDDAKAKLSNLGLSPKHTKTGSNTTTDGYKVSVNGTFSPEEAAANTQALQAMGLSASASGGKISLGSYNDQAGADNAKSTASMLGLQATVKPKTSSVPIYSISAGKFVTRDEAQAALSRANGAGVSGGSIGNL